jgi:hypothetical protein
MPGEAERPGEAGELLAVFRAVERWRGYRRRGQHERVEVGENPLDRLGQRGPLVAGAGIVGGPDLKGRFQLGPHVGAVADFVRAHPVPVECRSLG